LFCIFFSLFDSLFFFLLPFLLILPLTDVVRLYSAIPLRPVRPPTPTFSCITRALPVQKPSHSVSPIFPRPPALVVLPLPFRIPPSSGFSRFIPLYVRCLAALFSSHLAPFFQCTSHTCSHLTKFLVSPRLCGRSPPSTSLSLHLCLPRPFFPQS